MSEMRLIQTKSLEFKPCVSIKDPVSALTHFIGFAAAIFLTPLILSRTGIRHSDPATLAAVSIYCLSLILLYGASSAYHTFVLPERKTRILKKIDHMSIFLLIAGTYTPICLITLPKQGGIPLLIGVWTAALCGIAMKLFWVYCPRYISSLLYISMGWMAISRIGVIYHSFSPLAFFWLLSGGLFYTIGGIIYALKISISKNWSEHEIFHIFVLLGSLCHYILIFQFVI